MNRLILNIILILFLCAFPLYAYVGDSYVTPDSWSRHVNASGIKASTKGIDLGDSGILKAGLSTRLSVKYSGETDWSLYQYARLRLSEAKLGNGIVNVNVNMRGVYDNLPSINDGSYHKFYDGLYVSRKYDEYSRLSGAYDGNFRIYQGNVELKNVVPYLDITAGRLYLNTLDMNKIDGGNIRVNTSEYLQLDVHGGNSVSYYSNLHTSVAGFHFEVPVSVSSTKIQGEYSYYIHHTDEDYNTHVAKGRIDQQLNFPDILNGTVYLEGSIIGKTMFYEGGFDINVDKSRTGISAYISGQYDKNRGAVNSYVSLYENILSGSSEYVMGGIMLTQGITDYVLLGLGWESRFNFSESYGDRDFQRVFANVDLVGLIHKNNYLSIIVDWYDIPTYRRQQGSSQVMGGFRMTQVFFDGLEAWLGVNVQNYQYKSNPIKSYHQYGEDIISLSNRNENTTLAYIGALYRPVDWCVIQLDYTFEYADLFKSASLQPDVHTISLWANFIW